MSLRFGSWVLVAVVPWATGCFIAYPRVDRCPGATVPDGADVVAIVARAKSVQHGTAPVPEVTHTLRRVELDDGAVGPQFQPYLYWGFILGNWHSAYVQTKLYRRGYKTVILDRERNDPAVEWTPAATPEEREEAVRALLYHARREWSSRVPVPGLVPGATDPKHRDVLLFGASEFEDVARLYPDGSEGRARCLAKAETLRGRAEE